MSISARSAALALLLRVERDGAYLNRVLDGFVKEHPDGDRREINLVSELCWGVMRHRGTLDFYLRQVSTRPLRDIDTHVLYVLRLGLYQLMFMDRVPEHAAVDESVNLVKKDNGAHGRFVNAVLRSFLRRRGELDAPQSLKEPNVRLSATYSAPLWLIKQSRRDIRCRYPAFDDAAVEEALQRRLTWISQRAGVTLRTNTLRISRDALLELLREVGIEAQAGAYAPEAIHLAPGSAVADVPGGDEGLWMIQDEGSMLVAHLAQPQPGQRVLDIGAAPGGKTTHLAQLMDNQGSLTALDVSASRIPLINRNAQRLGVTIAHAITGDILQSVNGIAPKDFDVVVVDAPCSGLGVLRRHPEAKWRRDGSAIPELARQQAAMLDAAAQYVKPGGRLVYSVCTTTCAEGPQLMDDYLQRHDDFRLLPAPTGKNLVWPRISPRGYVDFHDIDDVDGFFAVALEKRP